MNKTKQTAVLAAVLLGAAGFNALADQAISPAGSERSYTGKITAVDSQNHMITVKSWMFTKKEFNLGENCAYAMVENQNGSAADLRPGEMVKVQYQRDHGVRIADRIEQQPLRFKGVVTVIDPANHTLMLHRPGLDKPMEIAANCSVVLKDDRSGSLADIQPGDHVTVTYEIPNDVPTVRQVAQTSAEFTGKLTAIDLSDQTLKAKDTFSTMDFNVADNCSIVVNGKPGGKLSELRPDERLVFNYDSINGVNVVSRIAPASENGTNTSYSATPGYTGYPGGY